MSWKLVDGRMLNSPSLPPSLPLPLPLYLSSHLSLSPTYIRSHTVTRHRFTCAYPNYKVYFLHVLFPAWTVVVASNKNKSWRQFQTINVPACEQQEKYRRELFWSFRIETFYKQREELSTNLKFPMDLCSFYLIKCSLAFGQLGMPHRSTLHTFIKGKNVPCS